MKNVYRQMFGVVILLLSLVFCGNVFAGTSEMVKEVNTIVREAEKKMHSGKNQEADALLQKADALIQQVKTEEPANKNILRTEKKYDRVRKNVDRKLGQSAAKNTRSTTPQAGAVKSDNTKLPGGVKKRLKDISRHLDNAERYATKDSKQAQYKLSQAEELFDEIDKMYSGQFSSSHPDYAAVKNRFDALSGKAAKQGVAEAEAKEGASAAKAAMEKQSAEWVAKFQEFLSYRGQEGHNPAKVVFVPGTSEPEKFDEAKKRYKEFKAFHEEYKQTDFPNGKTWKLEELGDREAPMRLKDFEESFADRIESVAGDAEKDIDRAMSYLEKDNGWTRDKSVKPNLVDRNRMVSIQEATRKMITALGSGSPKAQGIQKKFDALVAKDKEHRQIRKERTFMTPDKYKGKDMKALKKKAVSLVESNKKEGGKALRCTIISSNWQEETVKEWTDTSRTTWRVRTTRSLTAQVAAKTSDGVRLITVALAKDRQTDGKWGALYGNLHQYSDPMLKSNVNKSGP